MKTQASQSRLFRHGERGFYLIGLLLVVAIIMILSGRNFIGSTSGSSGAAGGSGSAADAAVGLFVDPLATGANQVQMGNNRIENTKGVACDTNRMQAEVDLQMIASANGGLLPHPDTVRKKAGYFACPTGGNLQFDIHGNVFCTQHKPAPPDTEVARF